MDQPSNLADRRDRWLAWSKEIRLDPVFGHFGRFQESLGIELTMRCPLACRHCSYSSGPDRTETVDSTVVDFVRQAVAGGKVKLLIISGGEPMLEPDLLNDIAAMARGADVAIAVNTSAYWGRNAAHARQFLDGFPDISHLNISVDEYHEEFIPLSHARTAALAALDRGLSVTLMPRVWNPPDDPYLDRIEAAFGPELLNRIAVDLQGISVDGRGRQLPDAASRMPRHRTNFPEGACRVANQPTVNTCGTVKACCNHNVAMASAPLQLGNIAERDYATVAADASNRRILQAIRTWGPARLARMLQHAGYGDSLRGRYPENDICSLCEDIMTQPHLVSALEDRLADPVVFSELYVGRLMLLGEVFDDPPDGVDQRETVHAI